MNMKIKFVGSAKDFREAKLNISQGIRLLLGTDATNGFLKLKLLEPNVLEMFNKTLGIDIDFLAYQDMVLGHFQELDLEETIGDRLDMTTYPDQMYAFVEIV